MAFKSDLIALSLLSGAETAHAFSSFLPSSFTVKSFALCAADENEIKQNIVNLRSGYPLALVFGLGLGAVISLIAKSPLPFLFSAGAGGLMVMLYERNLPAERRFRSPFDLLGLTQPAQVASQIPETIVSAL